MQNFMQIPLRGASRQMGEIYAKIFLAIYIPFFTDSPTGQTLRRIFCARWLKRRSLAQGCAFWGLKNLKLIFNVFIQKIKKKLQWGLWGKLNNY